MPTVDTAVFGRRERTCDGLLAAAEDRPGHAARRRGAPGVDVGLLAPDPIRFANVTGTTVDGEHIDGTTAITLAEYVNAESDSTLTWDDIDWLRTCWDGPIVVKGIQSVADARIAADRGIEAIVISNHGGRQLDGRRPPSTSWRRWSTPSATGSRCSSDGGIRRGSDVVKAVAAGREGGVDRSRLLLRPRRRRRAWRRPRARPVRRRRAPHDGADRCRFGEELDRDLLQRGGMVGPARCRVFTRVVSRPIWSGSIAFGLVNVPVRRSAPSVTTTCTSISSIASRTVHASATPRWPAKTRRRSRRRRDRDELRSRRGRHVIFDSAELAGFRPRSTKIDVTDFVALAEIDPVYYDRTYWPSPDGEARPARTPSSWPRWSAQERAGSVRSPCGTVNTSPRSARSTAHLRCRRCASPTRWCRVPRSTTSPSRRTKTEAKQLRMAVAAHRRARCRLEARALPRHLHRGSPGHGSRRRPTEKTPIRRTTSPSRAWTSSISPRPSSAASSRVVDASGVARRSADSLCVRMIDRHGRNS